MEEIKMVSINERLKQFDDGSFDKKVKEIAEVARDQSEVDKLLTESVVESLVRYYVEKPKKEYLQDNPDLFHVVPKKKRDNHHGRKLSDKPERYLQDHIAKKPEFVQNEEAKDVFWKKNKNGTGRKRSFESEDEMEKKVKKKKKKKKTNNNTRVNLADLGLGEPPDMAPELKDRIERMGGTDLQLVIMKPLHATDLNPNNNRLSIPNKQKLCEFLTEEEDSKLDRKVGKENEGITVNVIEPSGAIANDIVLKKWKFKSVNNYTYTLIDGWTGLVMRNAKVLKKNFAIIQLWSFRVEGRLWFQVVKVRDGVEDKGQCSSDGQGGEDSAAGASRSNNGGVENIGDGSYGDGVMEDGGVSSDGDGIMEEDHHDANPDCINGSGSSSGGSSNSSTIDGHARSMSPDRADISA